MEIHDLFRAITPPILYHRIPDVPIEINDHRIQLVHHPEYDEPQGLTIRESIDSWNAFYHSNYNGTLVDNSMLIHIISLVVNEFENQTSPNIPQDLLRLGYYQPQENAPHNRIEYITRIVRELYGTYQCFLHIVWHDTDAYTKLLNKVLIPHNQKKEEPYRIPVDDTPSNVCWNFLRHTAKNFNSDFASVFTALRVEDAKIVEYRVAYTLGEALLYQLFMHIEAGEEALNGCAYAECELCHELFIKDHGNRRFCTDCRKNHVRVAAHRSKKKGAASNAQETHP